MKQALKDGFIRLKNFIHDYKKYLIVVFSILLIIVLVGCLTSHADFFSDDTDNAFYQYTPYAPEMISFSRERSRTSISQGVYTITQPAEYRQREVFYDQQGNNLGSLNLYPNQGTSHSWSYLIAMDIGTLGVQNYNLSCYFSGFPLFETGTQFDYFNDFLKIDSGGVAPDYCTISFNLYVPDTQVDYAASNATLKLATVPLTIYPYLTNDSLYYVDAIRNYLADTYFGTFEALYVGDVVISIPISSVTSTLKVYFQHSLFRDTINNNSTINYYARTKFHNWLAFNPSVPLPRQVVTQVDDPITSLLLGVDKFITMPIFGASWLTFGNLLLVMVGFSIVPLLMRIFK